MLNNITQELETIRRQRKQMTANQIHDHAKKIRLNCEEMVSMHPAVIERLLNQKTVRSLKYGKSFFRYWELSLEKELGYGVGDSQAIGGLTAAKKVELRDEYVDLYRRLVNAENSLCKPDRGTKVCHVGCGPMPLTLLMWSKYTGCSITGLDISASAIAAAQDVLRERITLDSTSYDLSRIELKVVAGEEFDYSEFDVILISSTVSPKESVRAKIAATASSTVIIVERVPCGIWRYLVDFDDTPFACFEPQKIARTAYLEVRSYSLNKASI